MDLVRKLLAALGLAPESAEKNQKRSAAGQGGQARAVTRKRQRLLEGFVISEGMLAPRACTLRDISALGACVVIWDENVKAALLRDRLTLYLPSDRKEVDCAVMWRRDNAIGLKFTSPFRAPTRSYA